MATYTVNFGSLQSAIAHLEETLARMKQEIDKMETIKTTLLNDSLWYGPNKKNYFQKFEAYQNAMNALYNNAADHLTKLNEIKKTYANAEVN